MCGSGTFLIEAGLMATNTAPGLLRRRWPFQSWPDFDQAAFDSSVDSARQARTKWDGLLLGNDVHEGALRLAKRYFTSPTKLNHVVGCDTDLRLLSDLSGGGSDAVMQCSCCCDCYSSM